MWTIFGFGGCDSVDEVREAYFGHIGVEYALRWWWIGIAVTEWE